jgi:adenosylcobinamide kinase/adenosylcobinamide-phosphate guanylyltransferase
VADRPRITLVLGGARSGKSAFAQGLAEAVNGPVLFVATGVATDPEMEARIAAHRAARPARWACVEAPTRVAEAIRDYRGDLGLVLLDCLSFLVSNLVIKVGEAEDAEAGVWGDIHREIVDLLAVVRARDGDLVVVSNEVGMSLVPDNRLGRLYRDLLGRANQHLAARADTVYLMVAGLPITIKQPAEP